MAPLIVLLVSALILRLGGAGVPRFRAWKEVTSVALAIMFLFTAAAHFMPMKRDLAAMIPPPLTGQLWVVYLTGFLEIAGAVGLLFRRSRRLAALGLVLLLAAMLPANIYAAISGVPLRGAPPTPLLFRVPLQLFWMWLLWWSTKGSPEPASETPARA